MTVSASGQLGSPSRLPRAASTNFHLGGEARSTTRLPSERRTSWGGRDGTMERSRPTRLRPRPPSREAARVDGRVRRACSPPSALTGHESAESPDAEPARAAAPRTLVTAGDERDRRRRLLGGEIRGERSRPDSRSGRPRTRQFYRQQTAKPPLSPSCFRPGLAALSGSHTSLDPPRGPDRAASPITSAMTFLGEPPESSPSTMHRKTRRHSRLS